MTGNSEMVERVARAIAAGLGYDWNTLYASKSEWNADRGSRHDINVPYKPDFIEAARAAIEAMMEPTEAMIAAAWPLPNFDGPIMDHRKSDLKDYWQAMLSEALSPSLKEETEKPPP